MNFAIIGFGEVGSLVGALINSRFDNSNITVFDFLDEISGRFLDFRHACASNNNMLFINDKNKLSEVDFLIYAAGYCNQVGESRYSVAQRNKELVLHIFDDLEISRKTVIIAVTNPVEPVSLWIDQVLKGQNRVIGTGTSLDTTRLVSILADHFNCPASEIETTVIGEHGDWMIPIFSKTKIKGVPISQLAHKEHLKKFEADLKSAARNIRKTEKATKFGVAEICVRIIKKMLDKESSVECLSIPLTRSMQSTFGVKKDLFVSLPVLLSSSIFEVMEIELNREEKEGFQSALNSINLNSR